MTNLKKFAVVRFTREGWHRWPDAPARRAYLGDSHRHLFHFEVTLQVKHDDREVEFHDLLDVAKGIYHDGTDFGPLSCEAIATHVLSVVTDRYPDRLCEVSVFEDAEVGAVVCNG